MSLAHPLVGSPPLPVPPLVLAAGAVLLAAFVATRVRAASGAFVASRSGSGRWQWATRALAALLLLLLLAVARGGPAEEPRNLAAVALPYLVWPLLLVAAVALGPVVARALDPWRALGAVERVFGAPPPARPGGDAPEGTTSPGGDAAPERAAPPPGGDAADRPVALGGDAAPERPVSPAGDAAPERAAAPTGDGPAVWPAVVTGAVWAAFAGIYAVSVEPRALAAVLGAYAVVLVAGSVALGRERWLPAADAIGLVVAWSGLLRRRGLLVWSPPAGAAALLGAAFGGVVFARVRLTGLWGRVALRDDAVTLHRAGAAAAVVAGAALAYAAERWAARRGAAGSVAAALVPVVAAAAVATALRRTMVAAQLLPQLATDPFGRGWRLLGSLGDTGAVDINPWGTAVQQALAVGVVTLGGVAGAWVLARRVGALRGRDPAAFAVYVTTFLAAFVVASK